jgi:hypothetical protein
MSEQTLTIEEKAKKFDEAISSKEGLSKFLEENFLIADWGGTVDISRLTFNHDVDMSGITITKEDGILNQAYQTADNIWQYGLVAKKIRQSGQRANKIDQSNQTTEYLDQSFQTVNGTFLDHRLKDGEEWQDFGYYAYGPYCVKRGIKLEEITKDELKAMGYKLREKK